METGDLPSVVTSTAELGDDDIYFVIVTKVLTIIVVVVKEL